MPECAKCGKEFPTLQTCQYCDKQFCDDDYIAHMAWERRHEGLAEEQTKLWKRKRR